MKYFFVFDIESIGLHGEAFSFGAVIIDETGRVLDECIEAMAVADAKGDDDDREWVTANIAAIERTALSAINLRARFWCDWEAAKAKYPGIVMAADVAWPVEARFLAACVDDDKARKWQGPYPLIDIASVRMAKGLDPLGTEPRLPYELPAHNPLADARQSARLLVEAMSR